MKHYPMVTVILKHLPNFRCLLSEWQMGGGYKGFLQSYGISIRQIQEVRTEVLPASEYPTEAWEG